MRQVRDSGDLLVVCQETRRRWAGTTDLMDLIIDLLCEGDVSRAVDDALKQLSSRRAA